MQQTQLSLAINRTGRGFYISDLYRYGDSGFYNPLTLLSSARQTYNAPATTAASAGDPIGLWMPAQSGEAVTNLLLWTDAQDNAAWTKSGSTVTANVANNPSSVPTAGLLVEDTGTSQHRAFQNVTVTSGVAYTLAFSLKANSRSFALISFTNTAAPGAGAGAWFNLGTGAVGTVESGITAAIISEGNGWYRCSITGTTDDVTLGCNVMCASADNVSSYLGNSSSIYVARAQLNLGSTALDYQPNAGSLGGSNRRTGGSNMLLWTERFGLSPWDAGAAGTVVVTDNADAGPYGNWNAALLNDNSNTLLLGRAQTVTILSAASDYTGSVSLKAGTSSVASLRVYTAGGASVAGEVVVDLTNGNAQWRSGTVGISFSVTSEGGGWYRVVATIGAVVGNTTCILEIRPAFAGTYQNTADATAMGTVYAWGAMLNIGSTADTYSRNMDQLGGLLTSAVLYQSTSGNRGTRARRPASGINNLGINTENITTWNTTTTLTLNASQITSANGVVMMSALETATTGLHAQDAFAGVTFVTGQTYTWDVYVKSIGGRDIVLGFPATVFTARFGRFNLTTGTVISAEAGVTATIEAIGSDVYRCSITAVCASGAAARPAYFASIGTTISYAGDITKGVYVGGGQVNVGSKKAYQRVGVGYYDITESGQPDVWHTYWDGTSDYGDFGVQAFGTASLFAAAGQAWTVWFVWRSLSSFGTVVGKGGAVAASQTFGVFTSDGTRAYTYLRGTYTALTGINGADGNFHVGVIRWDGTTATARIDNSSFTLSVGSAAEEAKNITIGAINDGANGILSGFADAGMVDRALSDAEMTQLMRTLNTTYRYGL